MKTLRDGGNEMESQQGNETLERIQGTKGLWFLAYITPWILLSIPIFRGETGAALGIDTAFYGLIGVVQWYGISRRRMWGWWLGIALCGASVVIGCLNAATTGAPGSASGVIPALLWATYLYKRRHMFMREKSPVTPPVTAPDPARPAGLESLIQKMQSRKETP
jgi:hypothetical protein